MTSKELVQRAIHFKGPDRLPFTGNMMETDFCGDTVAIFPDFPNKWWLGTGGTDEWGCYWQLGPDGRDMGQVTNIVLEDIEDYASVAVPDAGDPKRYAAWEAVLDRAERERKYVVLCNGPYLFERAHFLHGFENTLMDILAEPEAVRAFLRHIARYHLDTIRYVEDHFQGRIHGYRGTDDWGTQSAAIISPKSFADVFQPVYDDIFRRVHEAGMDVWMHSCGRNLELIPLLIEAGVEVVNLMQPNLFPIPRLAELKGRICFEVCVDVQTTLPGGDREALAAEVQALLDACCAESGGLIVEYLDQTYEKTEGVSREIRDFCHEEYRRRDPFRSARRAH